jgi:hypothetical protein
MLKKSASGVLASLRGSTYRSVRLASSLAAALLDGLFEHPEVFEAVAPPVCFTGVLRVNRVIPQPVNRQRGKKADGVKKGEQRASCRNPALFVREPEAPLDRSLGTDPQPSRQVDRQRRFR